MYRAVCPVFHTRHSSSVQLIIDQGVLLYYIADSGF